MNSIRYILLLFTISSVAERISDRSLTSYVHIVIEQFFDDAQYTEKVQVEHIVLDLIRTRYAHYEQDGSITYERQGLAKIMIERIISNIQTKTEDLARQIAIAAGATPDNIDHVVLKAGKYLKESLHLACKQSGSHIGAFRRALQPHSNLYYKVKNIVLEELSRPTYQQPQSIDDNTCCVCADTHVVTLPCNHPICISCAEKWANYKTFTCPLCRQPYTDEELQTILYGIPQPSFIDELISFFEDLVRSNL